jgi:TolA-binding protein
MKRQPMKRLLDGPGNDYARAALRSARRDAPSKRAMERTAIALGVATGAGLTARTAGAAKVGAGVATSTSPTTAAMAGAAGAASGASIPGLAGFAGATLVKALALTLAAGALVTGAIVFTPGKSQPVTRPAAASSPVEERHATTAPGAAPPIARRLPPAPTASPAPANEIVAPLPTPARAARVTGALPRQVAPEEPSPAASAPDLTLAMSYLEAARAALAAGDPVTALAHVSDYERRFPSGALSPEASVLRIDALVAMGARTDALTAADRFLADMPDSPHARHVRAIVAQIRDRGTNP